MSEYKIPDEYYFRIHHVRPRFKSDIENVLIYMAEELTAIGEKNVDEFIQEANAAIYRYPGNAHRELKTINNWRTEISALFGFIEHTDTTDRPSRRAIELAQRQDLVESFKIWLYSFQYPGAHIKPKNVLEQIEAGVHFKPAQYILQVLKYANGNNGNSIGITKFEVCHCIFNDLRVTRDNEGAGKTWERIRKNRKENVTYDQTGDVIRYAGDIIDYMEIANILKTYDNRTYYLNTLEEEAIIKFCESTEWYAGYDKMIAERSGSMAAVKDCVNHWFAYVNRDIRDTDFSTDILSYIASNQEELKQLKENAENDEIDTATIEFLYAEDEYTKRIKTYFDYFTAKDIGDIGEGLVYGHECMRIKLAGKEELIHLIKRIPTHFAVGYDISSIELDERKRYIEVKTTISSKPLHFNKIHLTKNEWNTANSIRDRYYIYRLQLSKTKRTLFLLQDPVGLYKQDLIDMIPSNGADITFDPKKVGQYEELLTWKN
ncbi:protein NO VEIN domain-containing protein [Avibacterium avium]|uniref:protein NO VEIN domain-containing protein n=1 Tax=Avibacterium avium TaxID=751 RepID=UPI003BF8BBEC